MVDYDKKSISDTTGFAGKAPKTKFKAKYRKMNRQ
jgi:hypothetical protein